MNQFVVLSITSQIFAGTGWCILYIFPVSKLKKSLSKLQFSMYYQYSVILLWDCVMKDVEN